MNTDSSIIVNKFEFLLDVYLVQESTELEILQFKVALTLFQI